MNKHLFAVLTALTLLAVACSSDGGVVATDTETPATTSADSVETTEAAPSTTDAPQDVEPEAPDTTELGPEGCASQEPGATSFTLDTGDAKHPVRIFLPSSYDGSPMPLVLNWHGLGSEGPQQAQFTDYETLAEAEGFLVAHPTGVPAPGDTRNSWELAQFDNPDRDDIAMAEFMIDYLIANYCADPTRVYSTGMSNGGFFTSRLVCELPDRIAAAVSVAGLTHHEGCDPERAVPFMAFHGTADAVVPFAGGTSSLVEDNASDDALAFFNQVMPDEFAEFAVSNGCDPEPTVEAVSAEVTRYDYVNCTDDVGQVFFEVADGGHTWPGSPLGPFLLDTLGYTTADVNATADGWAFMSQYSLP